MYSLFFTNRKTEKILREHIFLRKDIKEKLDKLKIEPRRANGAHPLHGRLEDKWGCWLGSNIRMIYSILDNKEIIVIEAVGSHKIY